MSRCYYLEYKSCSYFGNYGDTYKCKLSEQEFRVDDPQVKHTCNSDTCDAYERCRVFQERR